MADIINYYDELLGGDRDATLAEINKSLNDLKLQLSSKVLRPSSQKDKWVRQLDLIEQAFVVFKDEDSREMYDLELRRAGAPTEAEANDIDWTTRAWNYYIVGDNGAALVASRKAKEKEPKSPMPFVVAAWVQLKDKEWKQAKQEADEAYVLDDQVEDSVDVQMVRGTAYFFMGNVEHKSDPLDDYNRALTSFDKALTKAAPGEQAEIHWRKGFTFEAMGNYQAEFDEGIQGLSVGTEISDTMRHNLEKITSDAINWLCNKGDDAKAAIKMHEAKKAQVAQSSIPASSKKAITDNVDANLARLRKLDDLWTRREAASRVTSPTGIQPGVPLIPIVAAVVFFFAMIGTFNVSRGAGVVCLIITAAIIGYVVYAFNKRTQYIQAAQRYVAAQNELAYVADQLNVTPPLTESIWMKD